MARPPAPLERKARTTAELDEVITWLTGFDNAAIEHHLAHQTTFADFFAHSSLNPNAALITGVICGERVEEIDEPLMQQVRYLTSSSTSSGRARRWRRCCGPEA